MGVDRFVPIAVIPDLEQFDAPILSIDIRLGLKTGSIASIVRYLTAPLSEGLSGSERFGVPVPWNCGLGRRESRWNSYGVVSETINV